MSVMESLSPSVKIPENEMVHTATFGGVRLIQDSTVIEYFTGTSG